MPKLPPLSRIEYNAIERHCQQLIDGAKNAMMDLRSIPVAYRSTYEIGQIEYWDHVIKALEWATETARQRLRVSGHGANVKDK